MKKHLKNEWADVTADYSMFDFENSIVKYNPKVTMNTYMGDEGVIILAQEKIEIEGATFGGPFHSLGHFLEAPDKYVNLPYFGTKLNSPQIWAREGRATLIHIAILKACGYKFSRDEMSDIMKTLEWYYRVHFGASQDGPTPEHLRPATRKMIQKEFRYWTKKRILSEWHRKNRLIESMPKYKWPKMIWGMLGAKKVNDMTSGIKGKAA